MTRRWTTLGMVIGLMISASPGLGQQSADPRLSDPAFAQVREEALSSTKCSGRTNPIGVSALCGGKPVAAYIAFTHTFSVQ